MHVDRSETCAWDIFPDLSSRTQFTLHKGCTVGDLMYLHLCLLHNPYTKTKILILNAQICYVRVNRLVNLTFTLFVIHLKSVFLKKTISIQLNDFKQLMWPFQFVFKCSDEGQSLFSREDDSKITLTTSKNLILQNHQANFNQTWHKAFLGEGDSSLFKWRAMSFTKGRS